MNDEIFSIQQIKTWLYEGECDPQTAACIIKAKNPEKCLLTIKFPSDDVKKSEKPYTTMKDRELENIVELLCEGNFEWWHYEHKNIFAHIEHALRNNVTIHANTLEALKEIYLNYIKEDKKKFEDKYKYIMRELKIILNQNSNSFKPHQKANLDKSLKECNSYNNNDDKTLFKNNNKSKRSTTQKRAEINDFVEHLITETEYSTYKKFCDAMTSIYFQNSEKLNDEDKFNSHYKIRNVYCIQVKEKKISKNIKYKIHYSITNGANQIIKYDSYSLSSFQKIFEDISRKLKSKTAKNNF